MSTSKTQGGKWAGEASTNIFYFASLKEIKWKVFESSNTSLSVEPSHPVIRACSRLFHASRLVTWHVGRNGLQLWIFYWPTDDIDLTSINLLKEVQHGMWDNGLPSDCLSHLYKAVHQHFERAFFKMGYARVGKYFVKADGTFQPSFQIGFFIHGDHHLCSSIELRDKIQVHFLKKSNLDNCQKLKVVLMPIGIECSLTGTFLNPMSCVETLRDLEEVFPAYQIDRNDPVNCHKMFLVETVISGHTMLYPASHVLIVNDVPPTKAKKTTLSSLCDEVTGVISSEGEVTAASTTNDSRDQQVPAQWRDTGFWTYKPPPDNVKCTSHLAGKGATLPVESATHLTKRSRTSLSKKRLQRSIYKSNLERNKYRDEKSPVINLPTLPIKTSRVTTPNVQTPAATTVDPLPRLQPIVRTDFLLPPPLTETFDSQPLTIECVENTACRDEHSSFHPDMIPGVALSQQLYKIPTTTSRKPLPSSHHEKRPPRIPVSELLPAKRPPAPSSPVKKIKVEPKTEPVDMYTSTTPSKAAGPDSGDYKSKGNKALTHEVDIKVSLDLDKLFESDEDEDDDTQTVLDQNLPGLPESCLTPDTLTDPKCILSPPSQVPSQFMNPQSPDYPTPPSNELSSYDTEDILANEEKSSLLENKRESYYQLLFSQSSYSALPLQKSVHPPPQYSGPTSQHRGPHRPIMLNSPQKTPEQTTSSLQHTDITAELDAISSELKDIGALSCSPEYSRTLQMSVNSGEITLQSIGEKIMQNPDQNFVFPSAFAQANVKKELSDLPKLQGGQFLIKFGDSLTNKFVVNSEDLALPGGYSCIVSEAKSVLLDMSRMEIYAQHDHKSTVGYLPRTSISISLYQSPESRTIVPHNSNAFSAVKSSHFSPSFLKVLQELVRNVPEPSKDRTSYEEKMLCNACISTVGNLLESKLPSTLVLQKPRTCILPWKSFSSLAEKFNSGGTEQPLPSVVTGSEQQWMSVSPLGIPLWLPKGMEPYAGPKDVFYLVVTPENPHLINNINYFFKELSTVYELCHLGHHKQLQTKIRDGIMRVGKKHAEKHQESCDPWFHDPDDQECFAWQVYARTCQQVLSKYLIKLLGEQVYTDQKSIVIYFIDPFKTKNKLKRAQLISRCFNSMKEELLKIKNAQFIMQCVPVDYVSDNHRSCVHLNSVLKSLSFSVYNQALKHVKRKPLSTCLTGFGPVSEEATLEGGEVKKTGLALNYHIHTPLVALNTKPYTEVSRNHDTLFCAYSLSHDSNWVIVALTDSCGHMVDTAIYAVDEPTRQGGVPPSVLSRIWSFCLSIVENYRCMWNIVVTKMGNVSDTEDQVWCEKFKSMVTWNSQLQERCGECVLANKVSTFGVASACLLSFFSSPHLHLLPLLNRARSHDMSTSSHVLLLPQQHPVIEPLDRFKKNQEDSFTFYSGPDTREKKRKVLSSAYLASSSPSAHFPKHMGSSKSSVLLSNFHHHLVFFSHKKHVLCGDNHPLALRYILQRFDALSWLQVSPASRHRTSPLPLHMLTVANLYSALEGVTYVPP